MLQVRGNSHYYALATACGQRPSAMLGLDADSLGALALDEALMLFNRGLEAFRDARSQEHRNNQDSKKDMPKGSKPDPRFD